jgi:hypothetical protein
MSTYKHIKTIKLNLVKIGLLQRARDYLLNWVRRQAVTRWRKSIRGDKTKMQYLVTELEKNIYVYFTRANCDDITLEDMFVAHPESINLFNTFSTVLIMDSTYKTNLYRMLLFEIVGGVTSTNKTYYVALLF